MTTEPVPLDIDDREGLGALNRLKSDLKALVGYFIDARGAIRE